MALTAHLGTYSRYGNPKSLHESLYVLHCSTLSFESACINRESSGLHYSLQIMEVVLPIISDACLQAIRDSDCYVDDISKANVIFVYDYCYYIWWLAHIHSALGKKVHDTPGDYLIKVKSLRITCFLPLESFSPHERSMSLR